LFRGSQQWLDQRQRRLHRPCGQQQLGNVVLLALKPLAHLVHARHERFADHAQRRNARRQSGARERLGVTRLPGDDGLFEFA